MRHEFGNSLWTVAIAVGPEFKSRRPRKLRLRTPSVLSNHRASLDLVANGAAELFTGVWAESSNDLDFRKGRGLLPAIYSCNHTFTIVRLFF